MYQYEPLADPDTEIRLAAIEPGTFDDPICITFEYQSLQVRPSNLHSSSRCHVRTAASAMETELTILIDGSYTSRMTNPLGKHFLMLGDQTKNRRMFRSARLEHGCPSHTIWTSRYDTFVTTTRTVSSGSMLYVSINLLLTRRVDKWPSWVKSSQKRTLSSSG
jgi:hypothetical protein